MSLFARAFLMAASVLLLAVGRGWIEARSDDDAVSWCDIADSGVDFARFAADDGELVFGAHCAPLGIAHSKYPHRVFARVDRGRLTVVSQASAGTFVELLDLDDGATLARHR